MIFLALFVSIAQALAQTGFTDPTLSLNCVLDLPREGGGSLDLSGFILPLPLRLTHKTAEQIRTQRNRASPPADHIEYRNNLALQPGRSADASLNLGTSTIWEESRSGQPERFRVRFEIDTGATQIPSLELTGNSEVETPISLSIPGREPIRLAIRCTSTQSAPPPADDPIRASGQAADLTQEIDRWVSPSSRGCSPEEGNGPWLTSP